MLLRLARRPSNFGLLPHSVKWTPAHFNQITGFGYPKVVVGASFFSSEIKMAAALPFLEHSKKPEGTMVSCHVRPNAQESAIQLEAGEDDLGQLLALPVRLAAAPREGEVSCSFLFSLLM